METSKFAGRLSDMRDSPWLASEDLENPLGGYSDLVVTITAVLEIRDAKFKDGRTKAKVFAIQFREFTRMLCLNATNRDTLKAMFGRTADDVIGNQIVLYVDPRVKLAGKVVPGIRIKAHDGPAPKESTTPPPVALTAEEQEFVQATAEAIKEADAKTLKAFAVQLKDASQAVKDALRPVYAAREKELSE